jgi:hypothetical protein
MRSRELSVSASFDGSVNCLLQLRCLGKIGSRVESGLFQVGDRVAAIGNRDLGNKEDPDACEDCLKGNPVTCEHFTMNGKQLAPFWLLTHSVDQALRTTADWQSTL